MTGTAASFTTEPEKPATGGARCGAPVVNQYSNLSTKLANGELGNSDPFSSLEQLYTVFVASN